MKTIEELSGLSYLTCNACMAVWADALSWANKHPERITKDITKATNIIVLSCQVTDLAILSDFRVAEKLRDDNPDKNIYISGCLSERDDVPLPYLVFRLKQMREYHQPIEDKTLVNFEPPFWVNDFNPINDEFEDGNLFRDKYPLRIGKGCAFNCTYCTIKITRGPFEKYDIDETLVKEFLDHNDVVLIADSPTVNQIKGWCNLAISYKKPISIRNIEPQIAMKCKDELIDASLQGVLEIFHCPIQSNSIDVLKDMGRDITATLNVIALAERLQIQGTKIATNVIIDYKEFPNELDKITELYDYVSWNPLWSGTWNRKNAEDRFKRYIK